MDPELCKCILRSLSEAVCAVDLEMRTRCLNDQARRPTGVKTEVAAGAALGKVFPFDSIPVIANAAPVLNDRGTLGGAVVILQDNRVVEVLRRELRHTAARAPKRSESTNPRSGEG